MQKKTALPALAICLLPATSFAHQVGMSGGFAAGLAHPVLGFDHLLAMLSVGILSAQMGGRAIWSVPATFVLMMIVGGILGMNHIHVMSVETGIAFSVFALGLALAAEKKMPTVFAMLFVAFFAILHGHAHGTEMPYLAEPLYYALGFITGTAAIHLFGVAIGVAADKLTLDQQLRFAGAGIAGIGFHLLVS